MENPYNSSVATFSYFKPEILDNFVFRDDIEDNEDYIDICDARLAEIFSLDSQAEQELKSTIFFGKKFKQLINLYSSWRKYTLLFGPGTYIQSINCSTETLKNIDTWNKDKYVLDVNCNCALATFELNKLDTKYLNGVVFPEIKFEPIQFSMYGGNYSGNYQMYSQPASVYTVVLTLRSIEFNRKVFMQIQQKIRDTWYCKV